MSENSSPPPAANSAAPAKPVNRARRRLPLWKKLAFGLFVSVLLLGGLETLLYCCGVQPYYLQSDPYVGFQPGVPLFVQDGEIWHTNPAKLSFFNNQQFPVQKRPGEFRVFCLGGSTTFGHPYHDETSFSGWLRELLTEAAPERPWQVVNCGGISYASYRVCLLMQELVRYQPDLFIVYDGHNEFLEQRTYGALQQRSWPVVAANNVLSRTRIGTLASRALQPRRSAGAKNRLASEVDTILEHSVGPTKYHRDLQLRQGVVEHFHHSLDRMCAIAASAGARIIFVKPASNLRHFTPFKSEHGSLSAADLAQWQQHVDEARELRSDSLSKAAELLAKAVEIDPQYALGHWQAGDALFADGQFSKAQEEFSRAADEDVCPLRAIRPIQEAVAAAAQRNHVPMIDLPAILSQSLTDTEAHGIPGDESFLDHVHHTIEGNRQIAWLLLEQMVQWKVLSAPADRESLTQKVSQRVLGKIDKKADALALVQVIQVLSWAGKNDEALRIAETAEKTCPGLSEVVSYRGRLLEKLGREAEAFECYAEAVRRNPQDSLAMYRYAKAQIARRSFADAAKSLERAIRDTPDSAPASFRATLRLTLGKTYMTLERWNSAVQLLQDALQLQPDLPEAQQLLQVARRNFKL